MSPPTGKRGCSPILFQAGMAGQQPRPAVTAFRTQSDRAPAATGARPQPRTARNRFAPRSSLSLVGGILECRLVGAPSLDREHQRAGIDVDRVAEQLAPVAVVARNHAGHRLLIG